MIFEIFIIVALALLNGLFAMAELAIVSSNRAKLMGLSAQGDRRAERVIALLDNSTGFLATVQIGITIVGIGAGVFGGAAMAADLSTWLIERHAVTTRVAEPISFALVISAITYLSLVLGELVPKQIALSFPEQIAMFAAPPLIFISKLARPFVWFLEISSKVITNLLPFRVGEKERIKEDDIKHIIAEGAAQGEIQRTEMEMTYRVLGLNDRPIRAFMTTRSDVVWLNLDRPIDELWETAMSVPHSIFPVAAGDLDNFLGFISIKDLSTVKNSNGKLSLESFIKEPLRVPSSSDALRVLNQFKSTRRQMALVVDEHGGLDGIVTTHDLLEAIVGDLADYEGEESSIVRRHDGSLLVSAGTDIHELCLSLGKTAPIDESKNEFQSIGGLIRSKLSELPLEGTLVVWNGLQLEIVDMDGRRIDKVIVKSLETDPVVHEG